MKTLLTSSAAALALAASGAIAQSFANSVIADLQSLGYEYIEVKQGPTQLKAEAVRGDQKLEVIYDLTTGEILKQEAEPAEADEIGRTGVEIDTRNEDFLDSNGDESDDEADDSEDDGENDDAEDDSENDEADDEENDQEDDQEDDEEDDSEDAENDDSEDDESDEADDEEDDES